MKTLRVLIAIAVMSWLALPTVPVQGKQAWTVVVGGSEEKQAVQAQTYFPRSLEIAVGDTVTWRFAAFHTATFLSGQKSPDPFAPEGDKVYFNPRVFFPTMEKTYDGTGYRNSGTPAIDPKAPPLKYSLTFTKAGTYKYQCLLHGSAMSGTIVVKDRSTDSLAAAKARGNKERVTILSTGQKVFAKLKADTMGNTKVVTLRGDRKAGYSVLRFTRNPVTIKRGTTVTWEMADPFEIHTVTFLGGTKPVELILVEPQKQGPPKLRFNPKIQFPTPGKTFDGKGFVNSGIMFTPGFGPPNAPTSFSLTFTKAGRFEYFCGVHEPEGMKGVIIVK